MRQTIKSLKEFAAQLLRSTKAKAAHPHVVFEHNVAVGAGCHFGNNVRVYSDSRLSSATVGDYSYIGGGAFIQSTTIGKFCSIGQDVRIGLAAHPVNHISTYPGFYSQTASGSVRFVRNIEYEEYSEVCIGNDVWIGACAIIMGGVRIGHGAIVGAGAVVTKDVDPYAIVAGVPARVLRKRFDEEMIDFLLQFGWWDKGEEFFRDHAKDFSSPSEFRQGFKS